MIDWIKAVRGAAAIVAAIFDLDDGRLVKPWPVPPLAKPLARAGPVKPPARGCSSSSTAAPGSWSPTRAGGVLYPLGMLWPEMDLGGGNGGPPGAARRSVVIIAAG